MENRYDPTDADDGMEAMSSDDGMDAGADASGGGLGDDDLMGAIGIDLEADVSEAGAEVMEPPDESEMDQAYAASGVQDQDADLLANVDPYAVGANVAAVVRQLVSQKIDRIVTVAVEQAVAKELKRLKDNMD